MAKLDGVIYLATNTLNGMKYVGQHKTADIRKRICRHIGSNYYFGKAIRKYGKENFKWEILDKAESLEELNEKEIFWIEKLSTIIPNGYNVMSGGGNYGGFKGSDVSNKAISLALKGVPWSDKRRAAGGSPRSKETIAKIVEKRRSVSRENVLLIRTTNIKTDWEWATELGVSHGTIWKIKTFRTLREG